MKLIERDVPPRAVWALEQSGVHPLLARLYAARGVTAADELVDDLQRLIPPSQMHGTAEAAQLLTTALQAGLRLCIVADYDCDGATACAVGLRGLRLLGQALHAAGHAPKPQVDYLVPDRVVDGYGLTPAIAQRVKATGADVLITVDNGIASIEGVAAARALGLQVLVTDHHLPAVVDGRVVLPTDCVIVNPNQPDCTFESKSIAGVGVMFYVLMALRSHWRALGLMDASTQPRLDSLLPLVALGTVADVVKLDANNRRLVSQGLKRIRKGDIPAGMAALYRVSGRDPVRATAFDFGFTLGPRINAAGRLSDMRLGIEALTTDDATRAEDLARQLDHINRERRLIESDMREEALALAESRLNLSTGEPPPALTVFDETFHEGVIGIVAGRLKDKLHRPTFVFAPSGAAGKGHELKGSGRSIPGFHLRDALDAMVKHHQGLILRFGGHAMAAGCTIHIDQLAAFEAAFAAVAKDWLDEDSLTRTLHTDGALPKAFRRVDVVDTLHQEVWGQGFAPPTFCETVQITAQRLVGQGKHMQLDLLHQGDKVSAIWFGHTEALPTQVKMAFRLDADEWRGQRQVKFLVEGVVTD